MTIPFFLVSLTRKRKDIPFNMVFFLFATFIIGCGLTHLMGAVVSFYPMYRFDLIVKIVTAVASLFTAHYLWKLMPVVLKMKNPMQIAQDLEAQVQARTAELAESEEKWRITLTSIGEAVIATDEHGDVTFLNPVAQSFTGWTQEDAFGKPLAEVFHIINEKTEQIVENPVAKVLKEKRTVGLANATVLISKNGERHPIED